MKTSNMKSRKEIAVTTALPVNFIDMVERFLSSLSSGSIVIKVHDYEIPRVEVNSKQNAHDHLLVDGGISPIPFSREFKKKFRNEIGGLRYGEYTIVVYGGRVIEVNLLDKVNLLVISDNGIRKITTA